MLVHTHTHTHTHIHTHTHTGDGADVRAQVEAALYARLVVEEELIPASDWSAVCAKPSANSYSGTLRPYTRVA